MSYDAKSDSPFPTKFDWQDEPLVLNREQVLRERILTALGKLDAYDQSTKAHILAIVRPDFWPEEVSKTVDDLFAEGRIARRKSSDGRFWFKLADKI